MAQIWGQLDKGRCQNLHNAETGNNYAITFEWQT